MASKAATAARKKHDQNRTRQSRAGLQNLRIKAQRTAILKSLSGGACVTTACGLANCDRSTFYDWLKEDAAFAEAVERAQSRAIQSVEAAMFRRAKSMTYNGAAVSGIFLLKNRRGDDYQDVHRVQVGGGLALDRVKVLQAMLEGGESEQEPGADEGAGSETAPDA